MALFKKNCMFRVKKINVPKIVWSFRIYILPLDKLLHLTRQKKIEKADLKKFPNWGSAALYQDGQPSASGFLAVYWLAGWLAV